MPSSRAGLVERAITRLRHCSNIEILGNADVPRLSILSLRFRHGEKDLYCGFVVSLLNDLFGIQVRGGCSCAGPYGHSLLGMDMAYSRALEREICAGAMVLRPGWVRLNFNYFIDEEEFEYILRALELVAEHGWRLLPFYHFDEADGVWRYMKQRTSLPVSLESLGFVDLGEGYDERLSAKDVIALEGQIEAAKQDLLLRRPIEECSELRLSARAEKLR